MSGNEVLNDGINVFGRDAEGASRGFVVADHTVEEVKDHVGRNPALLQKVLDAESGADKPRSSLVEWLEGEKAKAEQAEAAEKAAEAEREAAEKAAAEQAEKDAAEAEAQRAAAASKPVGDGAPADGGDDTEDNPAS
jgi:membrane protein involved in colicin uptake